jgi:hypothetical protein
MKDFLKRTISTVVNKADPKDLLSSFNKLGELYIDLEKTKETELTKRVQIQAEKEVTLQQIAAQKELFMTYMEKSFDERRQNFAKFFAVVDNAIETNNMQTLAMGLDSINKLAAQSPFRAIADINTLSDNIANHKELDI